MSRFEENSYEVFDLFRTQWAVVTAGNMEHFNSCTIGWGSLGTLWTRPGKSGSIVTVYLHPMRYTQELMTQNHFFTVCFFPADKKKALTILGSRSGRDGDKVAASGLTPVSIGESIGYAEASLTFLCRKIYQHALSREAIAQDIQDYYKANANVFPVDENGEWQPHWMFIGEIIEAVEKT